MSDFIVSEAQVAAAREWRQREATELNAPPLLDYLRDLFGITIEEAIAVCAHPLSHTEPKPPADCEPGEWDGATWEGATWG